MTDWNDDIEKKIVEDSEKMGMTFKEEFWNEMETILDENEAIIPIAPISGNDHLDAFDEGPFREEYWDEMSLILDQEDRRRRRAMILRWGADIAAILLLTFVLFKPTTSIISNSKNQTLTAKENKLENRSLTDKPTSDELTSTSPTNTLTEQLENNTFHSVQITPPESTDNAELVLSRMETVVDSPDPMTPKETTLLYSLENEETLKSINDLDPKDVRMIGFFHPEISQLESHELNKERLPRMRIRPLSIRLVAATNAALAPKGNVSDASRVGSSNLVGIELMKHQVNWSYSFGINIAHRTGLNHELLLTRSTYGARLYREYQSVNYKSIGSIGIPVGVNYHLRRNVFGIRIMPTWNVMVNSTYHRYTNYNAQELLVKNNYGIKEGINTFDMRLRLMYERRITERLALGVNLSTGFFNQIDQTLIPDTKGLKEYSIGLNASYTILNF
ncbi:MAG: hypothetical protein AB8B56_09265 [Crocinitomicaceae bacterium]